MEQYWQNEIDAAKLIVEVYDKWQDTNYRNYVLDLIGMLQAGKTGSFKKAIIDIYNKHQEKGLGHLNITVLTTYALKDLNSQVKADMQDLDDIVDVEKITILSRQITQRDLNDIDCIKDGIVIIDEGEYGIGDAGVSKTGKPGRVQTLIDALITSGKSLLIMIVGATNYSLHLAHASGKLSLPYTPVIIEPGDGYRGIEHMMKSDKFYDITEIGGVIRNSKLSGPVVELLDFEIENNECGIHLLRAPGRTQKIADSIEIQLNQHYMGSNKHIEIHTVYSDAGYDITDKLKKVLRIGRTKHVIIIVVGAMAAGFRINENLKRLIRFVLETSNTQSTAVQGFPGRSCGYNLPYMPTVITHRTACWNYVEYQRCMRSGDEFIPLSGKLSTHLKTRNEFGTSMLAKHMPGPELEGKFNSLDSAEKHLESLGITDKISKASENVKDPATQNKFRRRVREVTKLKSGKKGNYVYIGWKKNLKGEMYPYTALVYNDGTVDLIAKAGVLETVMESVLKNNSLYKESI